MNDEVLASCRQDMEKTIGAFKKELSHVRTGRANTALLDSIMDPTVSRITLVTRGEDQVLEQIEKQLNKLIAVIKVIDFTDTAHVERQLVLVKVAVDERSRGEIVNIVDIFRGKIIDVSRRSYVIEVTGTEDKIDALIELLKPIGIKEIVRTGRVAMFRGTRLLTVDGKDKERAA